MNFDKANLIGDDNSMMSICDNLLSALNLGDTNAIELIDEYMFALNSLVKTGKLDPDAQSIKAQKLKSMKLPFKVAAYDGRTDFPSHITHRDITTKPEDQGSYGTCAMWTSTTVLEMIIWKLTGRYLEFSDDEIYNIYLDC